MMIMTTDPGIITSLAVCDHPGLFIYVLEIILINAHRVVFMTTHKKVPGIVTADKYSSALL